MKKILVFLLLAMLLIGCGSVDAGSEDVRIVPELTPQPVTEEAAVVEDELGSESVEESILPEASTEETAMIEEPETMEEIPVTEEVQDIVVVEEVDTETQVTETAESNGYLVVIDPGHQGKGNSEKEPIGPDAEQMKAKVSSGTTGCVSGVAEYELTLQVGLKLQTELEARGYEVIMVRTTHDVNISNSERAQVANDAGADAFIRIHADGSDDSSVHGAMTICQTPTNPYNSQYYEQSRALSEAVLDGLVAKTGCRKRKVWETDTMSGINWCQVPVTIVEMGFMTNPEEDALMATEEYQNKLAAGMADGIDTYFQ